MTINVNTGADSRLSTELVFIEPKPVVHSCKDHFPIFIDWNTNSSTCVVSYIDEIAKIVRGPPEWHPLRSGKI